MNLSTNAGRLTDDSGRAELQQLRVGENRLRVHRIGYAVFEGVLELRAGYRDTIELGLGAGRMCFFAVDVAALTSRLSAPRGGLALRVSSAWNKGPVTDARVWLEDNSIRFPAQTSDSGWYFLPAVPAGRYRMRIARIGFNAYAESVTVRPGVTDTFARMLTVPACDLDCEHDVFLVRAMRNP